MSRCEARRYSQAEFLKTYAEGGSHAKAVGEATVAIVNVMRRADMFNQRNIGQNLVEVIAEYFERVEDVSREQTSLFMDKIVDSFHNVKW